MSSAQTQVVGCPGVRLVSRPAAAVKALLAGKDDKDDAPGNGFGRNVTTLDKDIAHLQEVFPGASRAREGGRG